MGAVFALSLLPFSSYVASLPFIQSQLGLNNTASGIVFSSYLAGFALSSLFIVPLTDQFSAPRILLAGLCLMVIGHILFPLLTKNLWAGVILRALTGAGHAGAYLPGIRLVAARFPGSNRGTAVGFFVGAGFVGTTFSYTTTGFMLAHTGTWQTAYLATALVALIGLMLGFFLLRNDLSLTHAEPAQSRIGKGRLDLSVLKGRAVALNTAAYALHTAELYLARLWFPLLLAAAFTANGMAPKQAVVHAATLSGLMFMTGVIGVFSGGYLSDHLGRSIGAAMIFAVSGACSFAVGWLISAPTYLVMLGFFYGLTTAADSAIYSTSIIEIAPPDRIGSAQAVQSFVGFTVGAIVPILAGSLLDIGTANWRWGLAFTLNGVLAVAGVFFLLWQRRLPEAINMAGGRR